MRGFAMIKIGETGWVEKPKPGCGPLDAIIAPLIVAACTSDIHTVEGAIGPRDKLILGHEGVGVISEVGKEVKDFKVGDKVIVPCLTPNWRALGVQDTWLPNHAEGALMAWHLANDEDGTFAEFFHVYDADCNLAHMPKDMSLEQAVMLTDMVTTGFHGAEMADIQFGDTVVVIGMGPVGLMAIAAAKLRGAGRILAVGSRKACAELACGYGATDIINYKECDFVQAIGEATNNYVDRVIIAGGSDMALAQAVDIVRPAGTVSNLTYFGHGDYLTIPRMGWACGMSHKKIIGGQCPGGRRRVERLIELLKYGRVDPGLMVSHTFHGLDKVKDALALMRDKPADVVKPVVIF